MNILTSEQKIENYRELIELNEKKIKNLQDLNNSLNRKIQRLKQNPVRTNPLLSAARASDV